MLLYIHSTSITLRICEYVVLQFYSLFQCYTYSCLYYCRCGDGSCVMGERCDATADCFDLSDEYDCPDPASGFYKKCNDGQLVESTYM